MSYRLTYTIRVEHKRSLHCYNCHTRLRRDTAAQCLVDIVYDRLASAAKLDTKAGWRAYNEAREIVRVIRKHKLRRGWTINEQMEAGDYVVSLNITHAYQMPANVHVM